ncbi:hypothetical protein F3Y22_tig00111807pilonHSYRG00049 [Hibiscus syriacus]|uniref:Uncharacterized protein n=1 Tax=Hibiscus syriacus TaxID=106335 RepID=A0A6A2YGF8_HIBSY|nr:hypothetical protein F3Y22_tig00111807pilonHSYRG00049 [Hibiscus syriacus]
MGLQRLELGVKKGSHEVLELKTGATEDHTVVERDVGDDDFVVERHVGKMWGKVENAEEKVNLVDNEVGEEKDDFSSYKLLVNDDLSSRDIHDGVDEVEESSNDTLMEKNKGIKEKILGSEGLLSMVEESDDDHVLVDAARERNLEVNHKLKEDHNKQRVRNPILPQFSLGNALSPDASMADIIPMFDELHPLLGSKAPQLARCLMTIQMPPQRVSWRRARKGIGLMIEMSLIGLDVDIPFNITPISVARQNPFEFPHDSYDDLGLPSMPVSAPTIFQPRRNSFDLPYDSGEENPILKEIVSKSSASSHDEQASLSSSRELSLRMLNKLRIEMLHHAAVETTLGDGESQLEIESNFPEPGASAHLELNGIEIEPMPHFGQPENIDVHCDVVAIELGVHQLRRSPCFHLSLPMDKLVHLKWVHPQCWLITDKEPEGHVEQLSRDVMPSSSNEGSEHGVPNKKEDDQQHLGNRESSKAEPGDRHAIDKEDTQLERD